MIYVGLDGDIIWPTTCSLFSRKDRLLERPYLFKILRKVVLPVLCVLIKTKLPFGSQDEESLVCETLSQLLSGWRFVKLRIKKKERKKERERQR